MHHIKSEARKNAYSDKYNPFGRPRPQQKRRTNTARNAEEGQLSPIAHTSSLPEGFRPGSRQDDEASPSALRDTPRQWQTEPGSRRTETDNTAFGDKDYVNSPIDEKEGFGDEHHQAMRDRTQTNSNSTDDTFIPETERNATGFSKDGDHDVKQHHKWNPVNLIHSHGQKEEHDDNNGKDKSGKPEPHFTLMGTLRATILGSWINILLIASPVGIALHFTNVSPYAIFIINFIAIIPLAGLLSYATEEIALRTGEVIGGLLNASFGNAVELITAIIALFQNQFLIVQTSLLGSMLSNLLLVLGMCFFAGGINRMKQSFNITVAQTAASLLFLAVGSLIIPTTFEAWADTSNNGDRTNANAAPVKGVIELSHATALILLLIYLCYLFFQLKSHVGIYTKASEKNSSRFTESQKEGWKKKTGVRKLQKMTERKKSVNADTALATPNRPESVDSNESEDEEEQPRISLVSAIVTLALSTALVAINAEFLVDSINEVTCEGGISKTFVGLILLPIVGNAAEHATAVTVAIKDKMDLAIGVAVGSSMQIALLVLPLTVIIGWIAGKEEMTLYFDGFQLAMLFVAILLVNYLIADGESHWLEGVLLMMLYIIIAVAAWFYPTSSDDCGGNK